MAKRKKSEKKRKGLPVDRPCGDMNTGGTIVQSLVFSKTKHKRGQPKWTPKSAQEWAGDHGYVKSNVHETGSSYRLRQFDPAKCEYRTVPFGKSGISGVVETPQRRPAVPMHVMEAVNAEMLKRPRR